MNGALNSTNGELICRRPIITCAGELEVFSSIEDDILHALPQDTCEWKRSLGRTTRNVTIEATFTPFSSAALPKTTQWDLIRQPLFHIYWTECNDLELYKGSVKDDIESWLKELSLKDIPDWLIVVVENYDGKRTNKLLSRTTVLDKIRADFAPKSGDRCLSVINPGRVETRSADSWRGLIARIRHLLLVSYAKAITKLEDHIRQQRERRNDPAWKFMEYFRLQEDLAQILEMLGLYDEALIQYDELDALFSQFVVNCQNGDNVSWLSDFHKPLEKWHGLKLGPSRLNSFPSLLELRAYLFAKQAHMLLLLNKIWEVAFRCLPFIYTCTREFTFLEISAPNGALACWLFLACMEVLQSCDKHNQAEQIEAYSLHTASLWAYASQKLRCLGELCGLMPGGTPTSDQLHTVVYLSAGMGDNPGKPDSPSPTDKLKQALCSQAVFNKSYLELAELAMGTYKLIGRMRSARLVGKEVASFYMLLGEVQKSAAFLTDALRTFEQDNWKELVAQTQVELAECYKLSCDTRKFIRAAAASAAAAEIDNLIRWKYFDEMKKSLDLLDRTIIVPFKDMIKIVSVQIKNDTDIIQDNDINVELNLLSNFPREFVCDEILISIECDGGKDGKKVRRSNSNAISSKETRHTDISQQRLRIQRHLDYKQDKQLASANVVCRNTPLKRADSNAVPLYHSDFNYCVKALLTPLVITPGNNWIMLKTKATELGKFYLAQIAIHVKLMELVSLQLTPRPSFDVIKHEPVLRFDKCEGTLFSGIEQIMKLTVTVGSYSIASDTTVKLTASLGLSIQSDSEAELATKLEIPIEQTHPYAITSIPIRILANIPSKEHQVTISCPWLAKPLPVLLSFTSPLIGSWRLHTVKDKKIIQITVSSQSEKDLHLFDAQLTFINCIVVKDFNDLSSHHISYGMSLSYVYELEIDSKDELNTAKGTFNLKYNLGKSDILNFNFHFEMKDFKTLYNVLAKVEPTKGSEFCRVGALCHLELKICSCTEITNQTGSLMYEVLAEQSLWAVCGRTAGVISFDNNSDTQIVVLDVMPLTSGYLPLPLVCLSKYIPADCGIKEVVNKTDQHPRLEPFSTGQVYNASKGQQVYVINSGSDGHPVV